VDIEIGTLVACPKGVLFRQVLLYLLSHYTDQRFIRAGGEVFLGNPQNMSFIIVVRKTKA
jgi:hypothetical protein